MLRYHEIELLLTGSGGVSWVTRVGQLMDGGGGINWSVVGILENSGRNSSDGIVASRRRSTIRYMWCWSRIGESLDSGEFIEIRGSSGRGRVVDGGQKGAVRLVKVGYSLGDRMNVVEEERVLLYEGGLDG